MLLLAQMEVIPAEASEAYVDQAAERTTPEFSVDPSTGLVKLGPEC